MPARKCNYLGSPAGNAGEAPLKDNQSPNANRIKVTKREMDGVQEVALRVLARA